MSKFENGCAEATEQSPMAGIKGRPVKPGTSRRRRVVATSGILSSFRLGRSPDRGNAGVMAYTASVTKASGLITEGQRPAAMPPLVVILTGLPGIYDEDKGAKTGAMPRHSETGSQRHEKSVTQFAYMLEDVGRIAR